MKNKEAGKSNKVLAALLKNKYALIVVLAGILLLVIPTGNPGGAGESAASAPGAEIPEFSLGEQERRISEALSRIEGAGEVTVILTLKSSAEQILASDSRSASREPGGGTGESSAENSESAVILSVGSQHQSAVPVKVIYPEYLGALVVAKGADNAAVRLELLRAVAGLTGLGTDKITVTKMKNS